MSPGAKPSSGTSSTTSAPTVRSPLVAEAVVTLSATVASASNLT